jgi:ribonucleotide reductase beta subunit family protein with ferritin-like domain
MSDSRHRHAAPFGAELGISGLAAGTSWVFRDESMHINFAFEVISTVRAENPAQSARLPLFKISAQIGRPWISDAITNGSVVRSSW